MWAQENFWFEKYSSEHSASKSCTFDTFEKDFCSDFILAFDLKPKFCSAWSKSNTKALDQSRTLNLLLSPPHTTLNFLKGF